MPEMKSLIHRVENNTQKRGKDREKSESAEHKSDSIKDRTERNEDGSLKKREKSSPRKRLESKPSDKSASKTDKSNRKKDNSESFDRHHPRKRKSNDKSRSRSRERHRKNGSKDRKRGISRSRSKDKKKGRSRSHSLDRKKTQGRSKTSSKSGQRDDSKTGNHSESRIKDQMRNKSRERHRSHGDKSLDLKSGESSKSRAISSERTGGRNRRSRSTERRPHKSRSRSRSTGASSKRSNRDTEEIKARHGSLSGDQAPPGTTVAILGLMAGVSERMLSRALEPFHPTDVRLGGGSSHSAAFADFKTTADAQKLIASKLTIDGELVRLEFARPSYGSMRGSDRDRLWDCYKCGGRNFASREVCYRCPNAREGSEVLGRAGKSRDCLSGLDSNSPTNVLLLRCLSQHTTDEKIAEKLRVFAPVVAVRVLRDPRSGAPRGTAAVEFASIEHATHTLNTATSSSTLIIDNAEPIITYACIRHGPRERGSKEFITAGAVEAAAAAAMENEARAREQERLGVSGEGRAGSGGLVPAIFAAAMKARAAAQALPSVDDAESAAAEAEIAAAVAKAKAKKSERQIWPPSFEKAGAAYVFDPGSSYFFESASGAYYDPKSRLYFISEFWYRHTPETDPQFTLAVPGDVANVDVSKADTPGKQGSPSGLKSSVINKKEKLSFGLKPKIPAATFARRQVDQSSSSSEAEEEDLNEVMEQERQAQALELEKQAKQQSISAAQARVEAALHEANKLLASKPLLVSSWGSSESIPVNLGGPTNYACLLCKRGFTNAEQLKKHEVKSKLHAENLAKQAAGIL